MEITVDLVPRVTGSMMKDKSNGPGDVTVIETLNELPRFGNVLMEDSELRCHGSFRGWFSCGHLMPNRNKVFEAAGRWR